MAARPTMSDVTVLPRMSMNTRLGKPSASAELRVVFSLTMPMVETARAPAAPPASEKTADTGRAAPVTVFAVIWMVRFDTAMSSTRTLTA